MEKEDRESIRRWLESASEAELRTIAEELRVESEVNSDSRYRASCRRTIQRIENELFARDDVTRLASLRTKQR